MIPAALTALVESESETLLGSMLTAGQRAFVDPHGQTHLEPIWWLATDKRCWLGAEHAGTYWASAVGEPQDAQIDKGWTWDAIRVGEHSAPLRRGTRSAAVKLLSKWRKGAGGEPWTMPETPRETSRASAAKGAEGVETWIVKGVPAHAHERWLFGARTTSSQPFNKPNGTLAEGPIWIAISDRQVVLTADDPDGLPWFQLVDKPLYHEGRAARDRLVADGRELGGTVLVDASAMRATTLSKARSPSERWEEAARLAAGAGHVKAGIRLLKEGWSLGHADRGWAELARLLLGVGRADLSVASAAKALEADDSLDFEPRIEQWRKYTPSLAKALKRDGVGEAWLRGQLREQIEGLVPPTPPPGSPWPPADPSEVWAAALTGVDRAAEAVGVWVDLERSPRQLQGLAAALEQAGLPRAAGVWREAASEHRLAKHESAAASALDRAIALNGDDASTHWLRAAWAWADGEPEISRQHWADALKADPDGKKCDPAMLDALGLQTLGEHAGSLEHWTAAAGAWRAAIARDPDDEQGWARAAEILEKELDRPQEAIEVLQAHVRHFDEGAISEPARPRWQTHVELARVLASTGSQTQAVKALHDAIRGDFLTSAAFAAVLSCPGVTYPEEIGGWWQHLHRLHAGEEVDEGTPLGRASDFSDEELDALHLGGSGWLQRIRNSLDAPHPPEHVVLTRGLQRLDGDFDETREVVDEISEALGTPSLTSYVFRGNGAWGCSGWPTNPPVLLVGAQHMRDGDRHLSPSGLAFLVGVELAHLRCQHPVLSFDSDIIGTSKSAYGVFGKYAGAAESVVDLVTLVPGVDQVAKLQKIIIISRRVFTTRSVIDKASSLAAPVLGWMGQNADEETGSIGREGLEGAALQLRLQADRVALLVTGDARAAVDAILRSSTRSLSVADRVQKEGLSIVLGDPDAGLSPDEALRITSLLEFAAGRVP